MAALGAAAFRAASGLVARGVERVLATVVLAAATAVAEALALGLVALGGSAVALVAAAVVTWGVALVALPAPPVSAPDDLARWWGGLEGRVALLVAAGAGAWSGWSVWTAARPALGHDMVVYHLPEVVRWVQGGHPGSVQTVVERLPVGSYPLTHEVLLEWGMAIGRGFGWASVVTAAMPVLAATGTWVGLRALGIDRAVAVAGAAALVATPAVLASQSGGASLDPAALAWLVTCGALVAGARTRPGLLAPAVLAAALAVGTKTTAAPLATVVLVLAVVAVRWALPRRALAAAALLGVAVGGTWYLRNLLSHGWPLWPFQSGPWGDPVPPLIESTDTTFLQRPGATLSRVGDYYLRHFGGPLIVLAGAGAAALATRSRAALAATAATAASVLLWMNAPFTGVVGSRVFDIGTGDATRYLLPGIAAGVLTIALASRAPRLRAPALLVLGTAAAVGLYETLDLGFPSAPPAWVPALGAATGAVIAVWPSIGPRTPRRAVHVAVVVVFGLVLLGFSKDFVARHARTHVIGTDVARWLGTQPEWRDGDAPVLSTFSLLAPLAGDRLGHPLRLVKPRSACRRAAAAHAWLVLDRLAQAVARAPECGPPAFASRRYAVYRPAQ